jgi:hypothetical protein
MFGVLYDAKRINPQVPKAEMTGDLDGFGEDTWQ